MVSDVARVTKFFSKMVSLDLQTTTKYSIDLLSWIEKSVTRVTVRHHEACRVMPNSDPE